MAFSQDLPVKPAGQAHAKVLGPETEQVAPFSQGESAHTSTRRSHFAPVKPDRHWQAYAPMKETHVALLAQGLAAQKSIGV
jgi:hypothetical protein